MILGNKNNIVKNVSRKSFIKNRLRNNVSRISIIFITAMFTMLLVLIDSLYINLEQIYDTTEYTNRILEEIGPFLLGIPLVAISGYLIIRNIFQIYVVTDMNFFGYLKTYGMTPRQIHRVLNWQTNRLCAIGIPFGLALGYVTGIALRPIVLIESSLIVHTSVNLFVLLVGGVLSYLTVLISCYKPAKLAGSTLPVTAQKQKGIYKNNRNKNSSKSVPVIYQMSLMNLVRNKKQTILVICSLTLGFTLMCCIYGVYISFDVDKYIKNVALCDVTITKSDDIRDNNEFSNTGITEEMILEINEISQVEDSGYFYLQNDMINLTDNAYRNIIDYYETDNGEKLKYMSYDISWTEGYKSMVKSKNCSSAVFGINGLLIDALTDSQAIIKGRFDKDKFYSGKYIIAQGIADSNLTLSQPTYEIGENVTIAGQEFEVMLIIDALLPVTTASKSITSGFALSFFIPSEKFKTMYPGSEIVKTFFDLDNYAETETKDIFKKYINDESLEVIYEDTIIESYRKVTRAATVLGISISVTITFIGILNFINSMITAIISRGKELAMIQSIGLTSGQLKRLLIFEGLNLALLTLIISYIISYFAVSVGIKAYLSNQWTSTYYFTLFPLIVCTPIFLIIAVIVPLLCFYKITSSNVVDRFRD